MQTLMTAFPDKYETSNAMKVIANDWANNFLTLDWFAEYYDMSRDDAEALINICRKYSNR